MQIDFHKLFKKEFVKLSSKVQKKFDERFLLFCENYSHPLLDYHELTGKMSGYFSISITGDYRAQFFYKSEGHVVFLHIGTNAQLYG